jgi:cyclic beta-1,2-glucan synthetase
VAADVYAVPPHTGRGGWTWYTGSAGWMYQLILESLLGLRRERDTLSFRPCLPEAWPAVKVRYRHGSTMYQITITNRGGREATRVTVDGVEQAEPIIRLDDDHGEHLVQVEIG